MGAGIVFTSPKGNVSCYAFHLEFEATNNVVEYEALLLGLNLAKNLGNKILKIIGDSDLVVL
jgi:ribonuclease HI